MRDMMHRLIDSFSPAYLEPMTLSELYQRMCMNLVGRLPLSLSCPFMCIRLPVSLIASTQLGQCSVSTGIAPYRMLPQSCTLSIMLQVHSTGQNHDPEMLNTGCYAAGAHLQSKAAACDARDSEVCAGTVAGHERQRRPAPDARQGAQLPALTYDAWPYFMQCTPTRRLLLGQCSSCCWP